MEETKKDIQQSPLRLILGETRTTRRGFFTSAIVLAGAAALAGCGGGSGGGRSNGTYRNFGGGSQASVSVSIDRDGLLTFWVLFSNDDVADYGQSYVDDNGDFIQTFAGFRTYGRVNAGRIDGRTERTNDPEDGFNWTADRYVASSAYIRPDNDLIGTFYGTRRRDGVDFTTFLTVAPDGTATVFSELDLPNTNGIDELAFEGLAFDRNGNVPDDREYFLSLFGDEYDLRPSGTSDVILGIDFGTAIPSVGIDAGEVVEIELDRVFIEDVRSRRAAAGADRTILPAAKERIFKALREGRKVKA